MAQPWERATSHVSPKAGLREGGNLSPLSAGELSTLLQKQNKTPLSLVLYNKSKCFANCLSPLQIVFAFRGAFF